MCALIGPVNEQVYVFPFPKYLEVARATKPSGFKTTAGNGEIKFSITAEVPDPHWAQEGPAKIPGWVPFIGGNFGLAETFWGNEGAVSSLGTGSFRVYGQTGFYVADQQLLGTFDGGGSLRLTKTQGLVLDRGAATFGLKGVIKKESNLFDLFPHPAFVKILQSKNLVSSISDSFKLTSTGSIVSSLQVCR